MINFEVISRGTSHRISAEEGKTVLEALRQKPELSPPAPCAGRGRCGRCRVILESAAAPLHEDEKDLLSSADIESGVRLACRLPAADGMVIRLEENGAAKIETRAAGGEFELDPILEKKVVHLPAGTLDDQRSTAARVEDRLGLSPGSLSQTIARSLPSLPNPEKPFTFVLESGVPTAFDIGDTSEALWAAAVDIGTTTVALYMVNLVDGKVTSSRAELNRQSPVGADFSSRLEHAR